MRCTSWTKFEGDVYRCEEDEGHLCVHYSDGVWWRNKRGLPFDSNREFIAAYILVSVITTLFGGFIWWILRR